MNKTDENRYSRQLYVLGKEPMVRFMKTKVLVSGLGGLGVEISKNLILGGIKSLTLHDSKNCSWSDLSSHCFLNEKNIGENRAKSCLAHLRQLNPINVSLDIHEEELSMPFISDFKVIICTEGQHGTERYSVTNLANLCHNNGIHFIMAETRGVFSRIFCDFGENFIVGDPDGKEPQKIPIRSISKDTDGLVTCEAESGHELQTGDIVVFSNIQGMTELNGRKISISAVNSHQFTIWDTTELSDYVSGGYIKKELQPKVMQFDSLGDSIVDPRYIVPDGAKPENPLQIHLAFRAFDAFTKNRDRMPIQWDNEDAGSMIQEALIINKHNEAKSHVENVNTELLEIFSYTCAGNLSPMNSFIGGIVAQEVMKAATGKFCPLFQWLFFDAMECVDLENSCISPKENFYQTNSRYDGQISIFGKQFQEKLSNLKIFVVGAGAIGCELLKNMALMGIGTGSQGKIIVTDMDLIEKSNLCRQLLYRDKDIGRPKSVVAAEAVKRINSQVKIEAHENEVGADTENIYDEGFYLNLDLITNALDNIPARKYMDKMCVQYRKPLLESGTSGTMGNTQVIVPFYSQCYSDKGNPRQKVIPMCTLKHFPYQIAHTIQWARELFEESFVLNATNAYGYMHGRRIWEVQSEVSQRFRMSEVTAVKRFLDERPQEFLHCVQWARNKFEKLFKNNIKQLLHNFPEDHKDKRGRAFWSGLKRCPKPLEFNIDDETCFNFVFSAANLIAEVFGIAQVPYQDAVYILLRKIEDDSKERNKADFTPREDVHIDDGEEEGTGDSETDFVAIDDDVENLASTLPFPSELIDVHIKPLSFEKDGDNFHVDFITAASNLRALCYSIDTVDALRTKQIAGNIIPAIATSTSVVAGLVCFELFKLVLDRELAFPRFKDCFFNLAVPLISFTMTSKAKKITCSNGFTWNLWNRFEVNETDCKTLEQFLKHFKIHHNLEISVISFGAHLIYFNWMSEEKKSSVLNMSIMEIIAGIGEKALQSKTSSFKLEIRCSNLLLSDELPPVMYRLNIKQVSSQNQLTV